MTKRKLRDINSIKHFIRIISRFKPPDRLMQFRVIRNIIVFYIIIMGPLVAYSLYMISKQVKDTAGDSAEAQQAFVPMVKVFKVKKADFSDTLSVNGTIKGTSEIELKFEVAGKIASFNFREGDRVSQGEVIASQDTADTMTKLRHSKSKYDTAVSRYGAAKEKLKVYRELYDMGALIEAKLKEMEMSVDSLKAEVETAVAESTLAESQLNKTVISAINDGIMGTRKVEEGDFVSPNDVIGSFLEIKNVYVEMGVIEKDIQKIELRQKVRVRVDAYPEKIFWGKIDNISKVFIGDTRTLPVKVKLGNPEEKLLSGMYADCEIFLAEFIDTMVVPNSSIIELGQMTVIPVAKSNDAKTGIIELRKVVTGYTSGSYTLVEDGLRPGEIVVMETQQPLKDGMNVKIIEILESDLND